MSVLGLMSHPTGVRGLKSGMEDSDELTNPSHPTGVRGLKSIMGTTVNW